MVGARDVRPATAAAAVVTQMDSSTSKLIRHVHFYTYLYIRSFLYNYIPMQHSSVAIYTAAEAGDHEICQHGVDYNCHAKWVTDKFLSLPYLVKF